MPKETPGIEFPLQITGKNAGYDLADVKNSVMFNIKNILLTNPGERVMIGDFGVGINQLLFENITPDLLELIQERIIDQIDTYAPYITILDLTIRPINENALNIRLQYNIDFVEIVDFIDIDISNI